MDDGSHIPTTSLFARHEFRFVLLLGSKLFLRGITASPVLRRGAYGDSVSAGGWGDDRDGLYMKHKISSIGLPGFPGIYLAVTVFSRF